MEITNFNIKNINPSLEVPETIIHPKEKIFENNPINKMAEESPLYYFSKQDNTNNNSCPKNQFILVQNSSSNRSISTAKGSTYIGKYVNNQRNGQGILIVPEQYTYEGNFKNNLFDGYGEFTCKQYNYKGTFSKGKKYGKGTENNFVKKSEYKGDFSNDKKNGKGQEKYSDGTIYIGEFLDDKRHGKGKLILDGIKSWSYKGEFANDKINGEGKFRWNENKNYTGSWVNNELSGYGILVDGYKKYIGYFEHNMKHGYGANFYDGKSAILGKWENDTIEGYAVVILIKDKIYNNDFVEINTNINSDNNDYKFVKTENGIIIKSKLDEEELSEFQRSKEYNDMIQLFKNKIYPDFEKNLNNSCSYSDGDQSCSSCDNY